MTPNAKAIESAGNIGTPKSTDYLPFGNGFVAMIRDAVSSGLFTFNNQYDFETAKLTNGFISSASGTIGGASAGTNHPSPFISWGENESGVVALNGAIPSTGAYSMLQYDENKSPITASWSGTSANIKAFSKYAGAFYFRITMREGVTNQINFGNTILPYDVFGSSNTTLYSKELKELFDRFVDLEYLNDKFEKNYRAYSQLGMQKNIIYVQNPDVEVDNVVNFDSIINAMNSITDASAINLYEVQLFSNLFVNNSSSYEVVPNYATLNSISYCKQYVTLRGMGQQKELRSELPDDTALDIQYYETMHLDGGATIENLKIVCKNNRYPIHFERALGILGRNQNTKTILNNCWIEHLGASSTLVIPFTAFDAFGSGLSNAVNLEFNGCVLLGARHGFRAHDQPALTHPTCIKFNACTICGTTDAIHIDDNGSMVTRFIEINNCNICGYFSFVLTGTYIQKRCLSIPKFCGGGNNPFYYNYGGNSVNGLKIKSNSTGITSKVSIIQDVNLFGKVFTRDGNVGISGWVNGDECVSSENYTIPIRLGDCSVTSKTLILNIDGTEHSVIFDQNYLTGFTNTSILVLINTQLSGIATASLWHPTHDYYPEMSDVNFRKKNTGSAMIPKGTFVVDSGYDGIKICATGKKPIGFLIDDLGPGEYGRVVNNLLCVSYNNFSPLFYNSSVFSEGNKFSIQDGKLLVDSESTLNIIALNSLFIKIYL